MLQRGVLRGRRWLKPSLAVRRRFHSLEHPPSKSLADTSQTEAIIEAAYEHVPHYGFSHQALAAGARVAGYLDISPSVFGDGPFRLIQHHLKFGRQQVSAYSRDHLDDAQDINATNSAQRRLQVLMWQRLLANRHIIHHWQQVESIAPVMIDLRG